MNHIVEIAASWGLKLNASKCVVLRFGRGINRESTFNNYFINGSMLPFSHSCRDLGVLVDVDLKFHGHIRSVVAKASGLSMNILKTTLCREKQFLIPIYKAHIRPIIEFASPVWNTGYLCDSRLLEGVQRRWTKQVRGLYDYSYGERLQYLDLYSVKGRLMRQT